MEQGALLVGRHRRLPCWDAAYRRSYLLDAWKGNQRTDRERSCEAPVRLYGGRTSMVHPVDARWIVDGQFIFSD